MIVLETLAGCSLIALLLALVVVIARMHQHRPRRRMRDFANENGRLADATLRTARAHHFDLQRELEAIRGRRENEHGH